MHYPNRTINLSQLTVNHCRHGTAWWSPLIRVIASEIAFAQNLSKYSLKLPCRAKNYMDIMWHTSFVCLTLDCYVCHTLYAIHCSSDKHLEPKNYTDRIQRGLIKLDRCWMDMRPSTVSLDRVVTTCHTHCIYPFLLHRSQVGMDGRPSTEKQTIHFTCGLRLVHISSRANACIVSETCGTNLNFNWSLDPCCDVRWNWYVRKIARNLFGQSIGLSSQVGSQLAWLEPAERVPIYCSQTDFESQNLISHFSTVGGFPLGCAEKWKLFLILGIGFGSLKASIWHRIFVPHCNAFHTYFVFNWKNIDFTNK